jgi:hypothetical protein
MLTARAVDARVQTLVGHAAAHSNGNHNGNQVAHKQIPSWECNGAADCDNTLRLQRRIFRLYDTVAA